MAPGDAKKHAPEANVIDGIGIAGVILLRLAERTTLPKLDTRQSFDMA